MKLVGDRGDPNPGKPMTARIVDISGSGISLELPLPVPCGAEIEIEDKHTLMLGEVLRCDLTGDLYTAAVSVSETTPLADARAAARVPPAGPQ